MNLTTLTHTSAVCVQAHYASRDEAIRQLTMRLVARHFWRRSTAANLRGQPPWVKGWLSRMVNRTR